MRKKIYTAEIPVKHIRCRSYDTCLYRAAKANTLFDCGDCGTYDPFPLPEWYEILRKDVDGIDLKRLADIGRTVFTLYDSSPITHDS